jgi:hypothetical protein
MSFLKGTAWFFMSSLALSAALSFPEQVGKIDDCLRFLAWSFFVTWAVKGHEEAMK